MLCGKAEGKWNANLQTIINDLLYAIKINSQSPYDFGKIFACVRAQMEVGDNFYKLVVSLP